MKSIGGYFELELPRYEEYHMDALRLNSGKNCLEYILRARKYKKVYIPYYTCEVVLEPIKKLGVDYVFYHINLNFEIVDDILLKDGEALLYTNYYGLKQRYVESLANRYGHKLIVDNTQAFFARAIDEIDTFYTCRKFFGVPDGAYLYTESKCGIELKQSESYQRISHLIKRLDISPEFGFDDYHLHEEELSHEGLMRMSSFTERIMQSIDYEAVSVKRRENYMWLHETLEASNILTLTLEDDAVPMVYPYMVSIDGLRETLIENKIFVACYWPNVLEWTSKDDIEYLFAFHMQPLPIDQRYDVKDMKKIIEVIKDK